MSNDFDIGERVFDRRGLLRGGAAFAGGMAGVLAYARSAAGAPAASLARAAKGDSVIYGGLLKSLPRGGKLEILMGSGQGDTNTLNWFLVDVAAAAWLSYPAHDFLEYYDQSGNLVPSLAQSVEVLDGRHLRYTLRDARFHNGRPVIAKDVRQTFEWVQDPANKATKSALLTGVKVRVVSNRVLILELPQPNAGFRAAIPQFPVLPIETISRQPSHPIGCGPFIFKQWVRGAYVDYVRNPHYWNPDAPRLDSLRLRSFSDQSSAAATFLSGSGDFLSVVPTAQLDAFRSLAQQGKIAMPAVFTFISFVLLNVHRKPFDDVRVRQAVAKAIDRQQIIKLALGGIGRPAWILGGFPGNPFYDPTIRYDRDVNGAKALLKAAGFPNGFDAGDVLPFPQEPIPSIAEVVQSNLADVGIHFNLKVVDVPTVVDVIVNKRDYGIYITGWLSQADPTTVLDAIFATSAGATLGNEYSNPQVDQLLQQARTTYNLAARKRLYSQVMRILFVTDVAAVPTVEVGNPYAFRPTTNGRQYSPGRPSTLYWRYPIASTKKKGT